MTESSQEHSQDDFREDNRAADRPPNLGRRSYDLNSSQLLTKRLAFGIVVIVNAVYLASEAIIFGHSICP